LRELRTEDAEENQEDGRRRQTHENGVCYKRTI